MNDSRKKAWNIYNDTCTNNSEDMSKIVDKIPCDQSIKNDINQFIRYCEYNAVDYLQEEIVPLMYIEDMVNSMPDEDDVQQGGGKNGVNPIVAEFFKKHLRFNLSDDMLAEISERDFVEEDYKVLKKLDLINIANKAQDEISYINQYGGDDSLEEDSEGMWKCKKCNYDTNSKIDKLCISCGTIAEEPSLTAFEKWCKKYPKVCNLVIKSMNGFKIIFKRIVTEAQSEGLGELKEEEKGLLNGLLEEYSPENILKMIFERGQQLFEMIKDIKIFISAFLDKSFKKFKEFIMYFFEKIIGAVSYSKEKIMNILYPKTYLNDSKRLNNIISKLDIEKSPELYEKTLTIDIIMTIRPEVLDYFISQWTERGPESSVVSLVKDGSKMVIDGTLNLFKTIVSSGVEMIRQTYYNSEDGDESTPDEITDPIEQKLAEEQVKLQNLVYNYLNSLYHYLKTTGFFDSGPEIVDDYDKTSRYQLTIYYLNVMILFRQRWKYGLRDGDFELLDGGIVNNDEIDVGDNVCMDTVSIYIPIIDTQNESVSYELRELSEISTKIVDKYEVDNYSLKSSSFSGYYFDSSSYKKTVFKLSFTLDIPYIVDGIEYTISNTINTDVKTQYKRGNSELRYNGKRYSLIYDKQYTDYWDTIPGNGSMEDKFGGEESYFKGFKFSVDNKKYNYFIKDETSTYNFRSIGRCNQSVQSYSRKYLDCFNDPSKGNVPYDSESCPWIENNGPIKTGNEWLTWINDVSPDSQNTLFVTTRLSSALKPYSEEMSCSDSQNLYSLDNLKIGDKIQITKEITAVNGKKVNKKIVGEIKEIKPSLARIPKKGEEVIYKVKFPNEPVLKNILPSAIDGIVDNNFTVNEMKTVTFGNICKYGDAKQIQISILKSMLILDYDIISQYDTIDINQSGGSDSKSNIYFTKANYGNILAIDTKNLRALAMNRKKLYNQLGGDDDLPDTDSELLSSSSSKPLAITDGSEQLGEKTENNEDVAGESTKDKVKNDMENIYNNIIQKIKKNEEDKDNWGKYFDNSQLGKKLWSYYGPLKLIPLVISKGLSLLYMLVTAIKLGASTVAMYLWNLIKSNPTIMYWVGKIWKVVLDNVCDYISLFLEKTSDFIGESLKKVPIIGDKLGWDSRAERDKKLESAMTQGMMYKQIVNTNIKHLISLWQQMNRVMLQKAYSKNFIFCKVDSINGNKIKIISVQSENPELKFFDRLNLDNWKVYADGMKDNITIKSKNGMEITISDSNPFNRSLRGNTPELKRLIIYNSSTEFYDEFKDPSKILNIFSIYNNDLTVNTTSTGAQIFINDLKIDNIRQKTRGSLSIKKPFQLANYLNDTIPDLLDNLRPNMSKMATLPGKAGFLSLFTSNKLNAFKFLNTDNTEERNKLLENSDKTLKYVDVSKIYPYVAEIIEVNESPMKSSFRYTSDENKARRMRAGKAIQQIIQSKFIIDVNKKVSFVDRGYVFSNIKKEVSSDKISIFKKDISWDENQLNNIVNIVLGEEKINKVNVYKGLQNYLRGFCETKLSTLKDDFKISSSFKEYFNKIIDSSNLLMELPVGVLIDISSNSQNLDLSSVEFKSRIITRNNQVNNGNIDYVRNLKLFNDINSELEKYLAVYEREPTEEEKQNGKIGDDWLKYKELISDQKLDTQMYNNFLLDQEDIGAISESVENKAHGNINYYYKVRVVVPEIFKSDIYDNFAINNPDSFIDIVPLSQLLYVEQCKKTDVDSKGNPYHCNSKRLVRYNEINKLEKKLEVRGSLLVPKVRIDEHNNIDNYDLLYNYYRDSKFSSKSFNSGGQLAMKKIKFSSDNLNIDLYNKTDDNDYVKIIPKVGDYVMVDFNQDFTDGILMRKGDNIKIKEKKYSTNTNLYDIVESISTQVKNLKNIETEIVDEEYWKKKRDARNARLEGITEDQRKWNNNRDLIIKVLIDNFDKSTGKFNIECLANDLCPRFSINPGYFNIVPVIQSAVNIIKVGSGSLPEGAMVKQSLKDSNVNNLRYYFITFNEQYYIDNPSKRQFTNLDIINEFKSFNIFTEINLENTGDKDIINDRYNLDSYNDNDRANITVWRINNNYCDIRLPTMYDYLSTCKVWKREGSLIKEPFPIQSSGIMIDMELRDKIHDDLTKLGIITTGTMKWVAGRAIEGVVGYSVYKGLAAYFAKSSAGGTLINTTAATATTTTGTSAAAAAGTSANGAFGLAAGGPIAIGVLVVIGIAYGKRYVKETYGVDFKSIGNGIYSIGETSFNYTKALAGYTKSSYSAAGSHFSNMGHMFMEDPSNVVGWGGEMVYGLGNAAVGTVALIGTAISGIIGAGFEVLGYATWMACSVLDEAFDIITYTLDGLAGYVWQGAELVYSYVIKPVWDGVSYVAEKGYDYIAGTINYLWNSVASAAEQSLESILGMPLSEWLKEKLIPLLIKAHQFVSLKSNLPVNPFRIKYKNNISGNMIGGVITGLMNQISASEVMQNSGDEARKSIAKATGRTAQLGISGLGAAIQMIPMSNNVGAAGIAQTINNFADGASEQVEQYMMANLTVNMYIDRAILASQLFTNPCYLIIIGMGYKIPKEAYKVLAKTTSMIFNALRSLKSVNLVKKEKLKKELQDKQITDKERILKIEMESNCDKFVDDSEVNSENTINDLKSNITALSNQFKLNNINIEKKSLELNAKMSLLKTKTRLLNTAQDNEPINEEVVDRLNSEISPIKEIINKLEAEISNIKAININIKKDFEIAEKRHQLLITYYPYRCKVFDKNETFDMAFNYLLGAELKIFRNNKLIIRLLRLIEMTTDIKINFQSQNDRIVCQFTYKDTLIRKHIIAYTFYNQILVSAYYNSTHDIVIQKTFEYLDKLGSQGGSELINFKIKNYNYIKNFIVDSSLDNNFVEGLFSDSKYITIPSLVTEFLRHLNFFNEKNNFNDYDFWVAIDSLFNKPASSTNEDDKLTLGFLMNRHLNTIATAKKIYSGIYWVMSGDILVDGAISFYGRETEQEKIVNSRLKILEKRKSEDDLKRTAGNIITYITTNLPIPEFILETRIRKFGLISSDFISNIQKKIKSTFIDYSTELIIENYNLSKTRSENNRIYINLLNSFNQTDKYYKIVSNVDSMLRLKTDKIDEKEKLISDIEELKAQEDTIPNQINHKKEAIKRGKVLLESLNAPLEGLKAEINHDKKILKDLDEDIKFLSGKSGVQLIDNAVRDLNNGLIENFDRAYENQDDVRNRTYRNEGYNYNNYFIWLDQNVMTRQKILLWYNAPNRKQELQNKYFQSSFNRSHKSWRNNDKHSVDLFSDIIASAYKLENLEDIQNLNEQITKNQTEINRLSEDITSSKTTLEIYNKELKYLEKFLSSFKDNLTHMNNRRENIEEELTKWNTNSYIHKTLTSNINNVHKLLNINGDVYNCFQKFNKYIDEFKLDRCKEHPDMCQTMIQEVLKNKYVVVKYIDIQTEFVKLLPDMERRLSNLVISTENYYDVNDIITKYKKLIQQLTDLSPKLIKDGSDKSDAYIKLEKDIGNISPVEPSCISDQIKLPKSKLDCPTDKKLLRSTIAMLHPDKNSACKERATLKFQYLNEECWVNEEADDSTTQSGGVAKNKIEDNIFVFF